MEPHRDAFSHFSVEESGSGVQISGLSAAKHTRNRQSGLQLPIDNVRIEYYDGLKRLAGLPFDPPVRQGLFITASLDSNPSDVIRTAKEFFLFDENIHSVVKTEDYYYWFVPRDAVVGPVANGVRVSATENAIVREEWFGYQTWNELVQGEGELGVFSIEKKPNSLVLNGRVRSGKHANVGQLDGDTFGEPMMLRWYPKHQSNAGSVRSSIIEPYGLHPKLKLDFSVSEPQQNCQLYTQVDLPKDFFLDKYELGDFAQKNWALVALSGENDLEKPKWQAHEAVSGLFALSANQEFYEIPMHFRYQIPSDDEVIHSKFMSPFVFWACRNDDLPARAEEFIEPHELLGIESVFPLENTQFFVVSSNEVEFRVPTISASSKSVAEHITVQVIVLGAVCVLASVVAKLFKTSKIKQE